MNNYEELTDDVIENDRLTKLKEYFLFHYYDNSEITFDESFLIDNEYEILKNVVCNNLSIFDFSLKYKLENNFKNLLKEEFILGYKSKILKIILEYIFRKLNILKDNSRCSKNYIIFLEYVNCKNKKMLESGNFSNIENFLLKVYSIAPKVLLQIYHQYDKLLDGLDKSDKLMVELEYSKVYINMNKLHYYVNKFSINNYYDVIDTHRRIIYFTNYELIDILTNLIIKYHKYNIFLKKCCNKK